MKRKLMYQLQPKERRKDEGKKPEVGMQDEKRCTATHTVAGQNNVVPTTTSDASPPNVSKVLAPVQFLGWCPPILGWVALVLKCARWPGAVG